MKILGQTLSSLTSARSVATMTGVLALATFPASVVWARMRYPEAAQRGDREKKLWTLILPLISLTPLLLAWSTGALLYSMHPLLSLLPITGSLTTLVWALSDDQNERRGARLFVGFVSLQVLITAGHLILSVGTITRARGEGVLFASKMITAGMIGLGILVYLRAVKQLNP